MSQFSIVMAYMDNSSIFRRRNLKATIYRCKELMPQAEIIVAEQGNYGMLEAFDGTSIVKRIQVDDGKRFHKTKLLNAAIEAASCDVIVMVDADSYIDEQVRDSIETGEMLLRNGSAGIVYPFSSVDYLSEGQTRVLLSGGEVNSKFCDHGVTIHRQTGLCNMYLKKSWEAVHGFDEDFYEWGAEDDAFTYKIKRKVGSVDRLRGKIRHLFHPKVNTEKYEASTVYMYNRKLCACIRRMSDEDFDAYLSSTVSLDALVDKYEKEHRLSVRMNWPCTPKTLLTIDTTIYDIDYSGDMSFTKILDAVMMEDGAAYIPYFVHEVLDPIPDLSQKQRDEISAFVEKARRLATD